METQATTELQLTITTIDGKMLPYTLATEFQVQRSTGKSGYKKLSSVIGSYTSAHYQFLELEVSGTANKRLVMMVPEGKPVVLARNCAAHHKPQKGA